MTTVPVVLMLVASGGAAVATGDRLPDKIQPDTFEADQMRAADGVRTSAQADGWTDGVIRRHVVLDDVESSSTNPQHQLTRVDVAVDLSAQNLTATASFAQPPTDADAIVGVVLGTWEGSSCIAAFTALATTVSGQAQSQFADGTAVPLSRTASGASITLSATHPRLRETPFECAFAAVLPGEAGAAALSRAYAERLDEAYRPVLEVRPGSPMVGARAGRWAKLRVTVRNTGKGDAGPVQLTAAGQGVQVQQADLPVGALAGRATEFVELKVRLATPKKKATKGKRGKKDKKTKPVKLPRPRTVTLTVSAAGVEPATAQAKVAITPKPTVPKKLAGSYWWGFEQTTTMDTEGWRNHAVWFVDSKWAYTGWAGGRKPTCSSKVKECQRYTWSKRKATVRIGKKKAKVTSAGFAFAHPGVGKEKIDFYPLTLAAKGTKLQTDLVHQNWAGVCLITCSTWTENLSFVADGRFVRSQVTIGSWPGLGSVWSAVPPDQRGTYRVVSKGIVELTFDDGTRERHVLAIQHDPSGKPNPVASGLLLDDVNYYYQD